MATARLVAVSAIVAAIVAGGIAYLLQLVGVSGETVSYVIPIVTVVAIMTILRSITQKRR